MGNNQLTTEQRTKWKVLYRYGWRCQYLSPAGMWRVVDDQGRQRSRDYLNRDHAVAEVTS